MTCRQCDHAAWQQAIKKATMSIDVRFPHRFDVGVRKNRSTEDLHWRTRCTRPIVECGHSSD
jgi:hypothetical protein